MKRDTTRNYAAIEALVSRAEEHLRRRDAEGLMADLRALEPCTTFSGNEAYERWSAICEDVVLCLYRELPFERFLELSLSDYVLYEHEVFDVLDAHATVEETLSMMDRFGHMPCEGSRLFGLLAREPGEELTRRLIAWAEKFWASGTASGATDAVLPLVLLCRRGDDRSARLRHQPGGALRPPLHGGRLLPGLGRVADRACARPAFEPHRRARVSPIPLQVLSKSPQLMERVATGANLLRGLRGWPPRSSPPSGAGCC